jgi:egghead protein (zeste-white 4 protein)
MRQLLQPSSPVVPLEPALRHDRWRPGFTCFVAVFAVYWAIAWISIHDHAKVGVISWYVSVVWTLPILISALGLAGGLLTARRLGSAPLDQEPPRPVDDLLVVVVPTIAREDTCAALERVLLSFLRHLPPSFPRLRVDIITEEGCQAADRVARMAAPHTAVRVVTVPSDYQTLRGTRFKARANHYAHELRLAEGEARDDVWVLHMDDDTAVGPDTARALARFVTAQQAAGVDARHLVQGILTYPRELATRRLLWLADAVRPGCDISIFAATTGLGSPRAGLHGELLLVRASVEARIGWDFGPAAIVEDAQFALEFCARYPGRSAWFAGRSYGASPATLVDFVRQRERWTWGLLMLVANREIPIRRRLLLLQAVAVWICTPLQHPALVLGVGLALGNASTRPAVAGLIPFWSFNVAFCVWLYWEGLKVNARASVWPARMWWEAPALLVLLPLFAMWEAVGVARGAVKFFRRRDAAFTVITKPA